MEIGVSTATLFGREYNETALTILNKINSRVTEIFLESFCEYKTEYAKKLLETLGDLKVHSVHTLNTHFEPQLFSVNKRAYDDALLIFEEVLKCAQILGAKNYTMHGRIRIKKGTEFNNFSEYGKYFSYLTDLCKKYGVELCIENVEWAFYGKVGFFKGVKEFATDLKSCLDIKQARISGYDFRDYISDMGNSINTVHLSDHDEKGRILLPGKGKFDFRELFNRLNDVGFNGNMLIEVYKESFSDYDEVVESLEYLRNLKREVFGK